MSHYFYTILILNVARMIISASLFIRAFSWEFLIFNRHLTYLVNSKGNLTKLNKLYLKINLIRYNFL